MTDFVLEVKLAKLLKLWQYVYVMPRLNLKTLPNMEGESKKWEVKPDEVRRREENVVVSNIKQREVSLF